MAKKTISGARTKRGQRSNGCNPRHNNRDYLPSNADPNRQHLNEFFVESTRAITIEQIYEKLFQPSYEEWLTKERAKGRQSDAPEKYIDKIRNSPDKKNKKREQYEIIWGIGDMKNTGWESNRSDFSAARILLHDFAEYLQTLPEIEFATPQKIQDPNWQPKNDCCLIVTNLALHGDEHTPQLHMDFVPYRRGAKRGQKIQNAYAAAFEGIGYAVKTQELTDGNGNPVYKQDRDGNVIYKKNKDGSIMCNDAGEPIPEPVIRKESFGSIEWIEKQKQWIADRMMERHGWEREYKGKNKFGDVTISDFIVEDNKRIIEEQEQQLQKTTAQLSLAMQKNQQLKAVREKQHAEIVQNDRTLAVQEQAIYDNDVWIAEQEQTMADLEEHVQILQTLEEYQRSEEVIEDDLATVDSCLEPLHNAHRLFKRKEAEMFIAMIREKLEELFKKIREHWVSMREYERRTGMDERQRRSPSLAEKIRVAGDRSKMSGLQNSTQKETPSGSSSDDGPRF